MKMMIEEVISDVEEETINVTFLVFVFYLKGHFTVDSPVSVSR